MGKHLKQNRYKQFLILYYYTGLKLHYTYADDTVLLAESAEELQSELNYFYEYCEKWNLKVNTNKSKVMVFSKGRLPINLNFKMNNMELEIVSEFIHLGTMFQRTGSFKKNKVNLAEKASKAMYDILNKGRVHNLSVSCHLDFSHKFVNRFRSLRKCF
jgi:hypothetical protein